MAEPTTKDKTDIKVGTTDLTRLHHHKNKLQTCPECGSQPRTKLLPEGQKSAEFFCPKRKQNCAFVAQLESNRSKE